MKQSVTPTKAYSDLSIGSLAPKSPLGILLKLVGPILDRLLGIRKMRHLYHQQQFANLPKQQFSRKLIEVLGVTVKGGDDIVEKIPKEGPCVVVCNHPYGMIEGVIIAQLLNEYRDDCKILANVGLKIFREIEDYFIFANPLNPNTAVNRKALKQCFKHVEDDGLLVVFPAGRVSFYQGKQIGIVDGQWDRLAVQLAQKYDAPVLPIFISGTNSRLFHRLGRIYYRFRLLMLVREMFKLQQHTIELKANQLIQPSQKESISMQQMNDVIRNQCYLNDQNYFTPWSYTHKAVEMQPLIAPANKNIIKQELEQIKQQRLVSFKHYSVYYGYQQQLPHCVQEISRLRELTFRDLDEGSGEPCDTDHFDATYTHLLVFDHINMEIIGAYRMGQTDRILKGDINNLYLSQMFDFAPDFVNRNQACLEMGRSFIVKSHQNSYHGLMLLFKGIGAFVSKYPQYRTLYGTVSLTTQYDPRSVKLIDDMMVTETQAVKAKTPFEGSLHPLVSQQIAQHQGNMEILNQLVKGIEPDNMGVPVLLKQYYKLGAKFHCIGIDSNFANTPGLLLSVHLPSTNENLLKLYLGKQYQQYLHYQVQ